MDTLKGKLSIIGIGLAAIAIAGYIAFGLEKKQEVPKKTQKQTEVAIEESIEAEVV